MVPSLKRCDLKGRQIRHFFLVLVTVWEAVFGQIRYSVPEEMRKGSMVGNVALDLELNVKELSHRRVSLVSKGRTQYFHLNVNNGHLCISERIDRERLCRQNIRCLLHVEILVEDIMKLYTVEIEVLDVNDNPPVFITKESVLHVNENTAPGARFVLPQAQDADVGINSLQDYQLSSSTHFSLDVKTGPDGGKFAELVLENAPDREEQEMYQLILTATDGGDPARSGTALITVSVLDINDNAPFFRQTVYTASVLENSPKGTVVTTVSATDRDQGTNSEVMYSLNIISELFHVDSKTGEISVIGNLDFEETENYEFQVQAKDNGGLSSRCKVLLEVLNVNDNTPVIVMKSQATTLEENSPLGTVVAFLHVYDRDSGEHGQLTCMIPHNLPFELKKTMENYYSVVTDIILDREESPEYNITITATDRGTPPLSKTKTISLSISDINDNSPVFEQKSYTTYIIENTVPGASIFSVKATDLDSKENARVTYSITEGGPSGEVSLSSYISINSESGIMYALRPFDFEQLQELQALVTAQDGGSPALSSNVTVCFVILDQNDNAPEILYPSTPTDGSSGVEIAPRDSEPGYLITKVVAIDSDSGQNAWLSYQLLRSTDQGLFTVGLHTGEIRTARPIVEKDAIKQFLVVLVKDKGQTPLCSSVTVTILIADSFPEILSDLSNFSAPTEVESNLTLYLVITLIAVSFLFILALILVLTLRVRQWRQARFLDSSRATGNALPTSHFVGIDSVRAFLQAYSSDLYLTADSTTNPITFLDSQYSNSFSHAQNLDAQGPLLIDEPLIGNTEDGSFNQVSYLLLSLF
ncbi:hypothetical protein NDU88_006458 [Pleurodeles waltl]|uniref:Cadherin domain-containing protein n=1 Tax=Pleurodeles waltl TaxID=8319 RepID=A0AAV7PIR8_PLEWA|nr:hypothetical protein NDU88_006458 [Pleurodeles waltl]